MYDFDDLIRHNDTRRRFDPDGEKGNTEEYETEVDDDRQNDWEAGVS